MKSPAPQNELALKLIEKAKKKKATRLDLGRTGLTELPEELFDLTQLEELIIADEHWSEADQRKIMSANDGPPNNLQSVNPRIAELENLKHLNIGGSKHEHWNLNEKDFNPIRELQNLEVLILRFNAITRANFVVYLRKLRHLNLSKNQIGDLPNLSRLLHLTSLRINDNKIEKITGVAPLKNLEILHLRNNNVSDSLPLNNLEKLTSLDVSDNLIFAASELLSLPLIKELNISHNPLIPDTFRSFSSELEVLRAERCGITPKFFTGASSSIQQLYLAGNDLSKLFFLDAFPNLRSLDVSENDIYTLHGAEHLLMLQSLNISYTNVKDLSPIRSLKGLKSLGCTETNITDLNELIEFEALQYFECTGASVEDLAPLFTLVELQHLHVGRTKVNSLQGISGLKKLQTLSAPDTPLYDLADVGELPNLKVLYVPNTEVSDLTPILPLLQRGMQVYLDLEVIDTEGVFVADCPIQIPSLETVARGSGAIISALEARTKSQESGIANVWNKEVKLILVGNSTAGKSSLASAIVNGAADPDLSSTHGLQEWQWSPSFSVKSHDGKDITDLKVRILDFGGQEYYHDSHHLFFNRNAAYIVLWADSHNENKMMETDVKYEGVEKTEKMRHHSERYWLEAINRFGKRNRQEPSSRHDTRQKKEGKILQYYQEIGLITKKEAASKHQSAPVKESKNVIVVQNKIDSHGIRGLNTKQLLEDFPSIHDFTAVSAMQGDRLTFLRDHLLQEVFNNIDIVGSSIPGYWDEVRQEVMKLKDFSYTLRRFKNLFKKIADKYSIEFDDLEVQTLLQFLNDTNVLLYYGEDESLKNDIFLRPNELLGCCYAILSQDLRKENGIFNATYAAEALKRQSHFEKSTLKEREKWASKFIELMRKFNLIIKLPEVEDLYVAPQYMNDIPPSIEFFMGNYKTQFRYQYAGFIHRSTLLRFFSSFGENTLIEKLEDGGALKHIMWKDGLILKQGNDMTLIEFRQNGDHNSIELSASSGDHPNELMEKVVDFFDDEHAKINSSVTKMVSADGERFVPFSSLEENIDNNTFRYGDHDFRIGEFKHFLRNSNRQFYMADVFVSYSHKNRAALDGFQKFLRSLEQENYIQSWTDQALVPGDRWDKEIKGALNKAQVVIFLVSQELIDSEYVREIELEEARKAANKGHKKLVTVIIDHCTWRTSGFGDVQWANEDENKPLSDYPNPNKFWVEITANLKKTIENLDLKTPEAS